MKRAAPRSPASSAGRGAARLYQAISLAQRDPSSRDAGLGFRMIPAGSLKERHTEGITEALAVHTHQVHAAGQAGAVNRDEL